MVAIPWQSAAVRMVGVRDPRLVAHPGDRGWLLDAFARGLSPGERILQLTDVYQANGRITLEIPADPAAQLLFLEPPRLQPGGVTEIVSYVLAGDRWVRSVTLRDGAVEHESSRLVGAVSA